MCYGILHYNGWVVLSFSPQIKMYNRKQQVNLDMVNLLRRTSQWRPHPSFAYLPVNKSWRIKLLNQQFPDSVPWTPGGLPGFMASGLLNFPSTKFQQEKKLVFFSKMIIGIKKNVILKIGDHLSKWVLFPLKWWDWKIIHLLQCCSHSKHFGNFSGKCL